MATKTSNKYAHKKYLTGALFDPATGKLTRTKIDFPNDLSIVAKKIDCSYIEFASRNFNGVNHTIICDEEGKLKAGAIPCILTMVADNGLVIETFVNKVFICNSYPRGGLKDLNVDEFENLKKCIRTVSLSGNLKLKVLVCSL